jgi:hypothetical protein
MRARAWVSVTSALLAALLSACAGPVLRGASVVARGDEPWGRVIGAYVVEHCVAQDGARAPGRPVLLYLVERPDDALVLVEARPGYESLVVTNRSASHGELVFQAALTAPSGPLLLDHRLRREGGPGRMAVAREWVESRGERGFRAYFEQAVLACALSPLSSTV